MKEFCPDLKATILIPSFSYPPKMYRCLGVILILNSYYLKLPFPVKTPVAFSTLTVLCNDYLDQLQNVCITPKGKPRKQLYHCFSIYGTEVSHFSTNCLTYKLQKVNTNGYFLFSIHFLFFSYFNYNNKNTNTKFSYHFNLSSLPTLYHPITVAAGMP